MNGENDLEPVMSGTNTFGGNLLRSPQRDANVTIEVLCTRTDTKPLIKICESKVIELCSKKGFLEGPQDGQDWSKHLDQVFHDQP